MIEMAEERDTNSFKLPRPLLGYLLAALLGAAGGSGGASLARPERATGTVSRDEVVEMRERLVRIETILSQMESRLNQQQDGRKGKQ